MAAKAQAVTGSGPPGLQAINCACSSLYPDQPNPLQVTALVKYWSVDVSFVPYNCTDCLTFCSPFLQVRRT